MLRIVESSSREGRRALEALWRSRLSPDFRALRDALPIVEEVLRGGKPAVHRFVRQYDEGGRAVRSPKRLVIDPRRGKAPRVDPVFASAFRLAARRIRAYHERQRPRGFAFTDREGVSFKERPFPQRVVGVYVPGGRAFYPSSLLMGVVPARVAGVSRIFLATPPRAWESGSGLRWAARELGVEGVLLAGGAHGIAGLVSVCGCTKIVGPGNRWVAAAKHLVSGLVSVDLPAGPSEVLVVASPGAGAEAVAADLLAQAEHDPAAICVLFTTSTGLARQVAREMRRQREALPESSAKTASMSLRSTGLAIVFSDLGEALAAASRAAFEHVQVIGRKAEARAASLLASSGAVFVGSETPAAFGDYLAGPNHVLPTGGSAAGFSGLSARDFLRWGRSVRFSRRAALALAPAAVALARFEGLVAHARSLELRSR